MPTGADLVAAARAHLGVPYLYGGKTVSGLDCSGLVSLAATDLGVAVPAGSAAQIAACTPISLAEAETIPGALLWREGHDGISTGGPGVVEARWPAVTEGAWTSTYDGGIPRWTRAGLIPGITYPEEATMAAVPALLMPLVGGRLTSGFSRTRTHPVTGRPQPHLGADYGNRRGYEEPVRAPVSGTVVDVVTGRTRGQSAATGRVLAPGRSGNGARIRPTGGGVDVVVQHMTPSVTAGARVTQGQTIGATDNSGVQTAAHIHLELWTRPGDASSATDPNPHIVTSEEDFLMALSDTQQQQIYEALVKGGQSASAYYTPDAIINVIRGEIAPVLALIQAGHIRYPGADYDLAPAIVNTIREDGPPPPAVDTAQLAREIAPLLTANLAALSDADIQRIAAAAADEQARRLQG